MLQLKTTAFLTLYLLLHEEVEEAYLKKKKVLPTLYRIQSSASTRAFGNLLTDAISCIFLERILLEGRGT